MPIPSILLTYLLTVQYKNISTFYTNLIQLPVSRPVEMQENSSIHIVIK